MRSKLFSLMLVSSMLLASFGTAMAQSSEPFCGDLSAEDCALLAASNEAMAGVTSYTAAATYDFNMVGVPGTPADASVLVEVAGAFNMDEAAQAALAAVNGMSQDEMMAAIAENPQALVDIVDGLDAELALTYTVNDELAALLSGEAGMELPSSANVMVSLVDGVAYVDLSEFAAAGFPGVSEVPVGYEIGPVVAAAAEQGLLDGMGDPEAMAAGMDPQAAAALGLVTMLTGNGEMFEGFLSIERGDDADVDGQAAAVFGTSFDVLAFISSQEFIDLVVALSDSGALGDQAITEADLQQAMGMIGMVGPMIFQGLEVGSTQVVGLEDNFVHMYSSIFAWDLAGLLQMAAMSGALPADMTPTGGPSTVSFDVAVGNADFNGDVVIEAPADAVMVAAEQMMAPAE